MSISISAHKENDHYVATIAGGWWVARGATMDSAVRNVLVKYQGELTALGEYEAEAPPQETQLDLFG